MCIVCNPTLSRSRTAELGSRQLLSTPLTRLNTQGTARRPGAHLAVHPHGLLVVLPLERLVARFLRPEREKGIIPSPSPTACKGRTQQHTELVVAVAGERGLGVYPSTTKASAFGSTSDIFTPVSFWMASLASTHPQECTTVSVLALASECRIQECVVAARSEGRRRAEGTGRTVWQHQSPSSEDFTRLPSSPRCLHCRRNLTQVHVCIKSQAKLRLS